MAWLLAPVALVLMSGIGLGAYAFGRYDRENRQ